MPKVSFRKRVMRKCRRICRSDGVLHAMMCIFGILPLQKKVVFASYVGKYFSDSPLAIFEEMRGRDLGYRYVWLSEKPQKEIEGGDVVDIFSWRACYHLATARVWVDNVRKREWIRKRKNQIYVQTWHSGITNKRGEGDESDRLPQSYIQRAKRDSQMADLFVSCSKWQTEHYRRAFWYDGEILECGLPRSDVFYRPPEPIRSRVCAHFGISEQVHLLLYAPTFRSDYRLNVYNLDCHRLIHTLAERFGGEWKVLMRLHPNMTKMHGAFDYDADILNASLYPEINELIIASEWLITDYSSCIFDAMEIGRYAAIYATDPDEYSEERGNYFDLQELPARLCQTNDELNDHVAHFDAEEYTRQNRAFMEKCCIFNDGNASERVVNRILELVSERSNG